MKIWIILNSSKRAELQSVLNGLHLSLLALGLDSYKESETDNFGVIIDHPTKELITAKFLIGNVKRWSKTIQEHIEGYELRELDSSWSPPSDDI